MHPSGRRVWLAPVYVLHQHPYRDTSRIVEVFTREQGRLALFARGANGSKSGLKSVLRPFQRLLDNLGYGLELSRTPDGEPIAADAFYKYQAQRGPQPCVADAPGAVYGRSLSDLETETFTDDRSLKDAKRVLRTALDACLDGRTLKSREVMLAMRRRAT